MRWIYSSKQSKVSRKEKEQGKCYLLRDRRELLLYKGDGESELWGAPGPLPTERGVLAPTTSPALHYLTSEAILCPPLFCGYGFIACFQCSCIKDSTKARGWEFLRRGESTRALKEAGGDKGLARGGSPALRAVPLRLPSQGTWERLAANPGPAKLCVCTGLPFSVSLCGLGLAPAPMAAQRQGQPLRGRGALHPAAAAGAERPWLSGLKHFSDLFFNLNDAISHHTLLKDSVDFAKSSSNKNYTLKFPNELQLRNGSAKAGMENIMTGSSY